MASPHVAGVAALIVSQGITNPGAVASQDLQNRADPWRVRPICRSTRFSRRSVTAHRRRATEGSGTTDSTDTASWMRSRP